MLQKILFVSQHIDIFGAIFTFTGIHVHLGSIIFPATVKL